MKKIILGAVLIIVFSGCMVTDLVRPAATATLSPTRTWQATFELYRTNTPSPTKTPVPVDPNIQYRDDFSDDESGWWVIDDKSGKMYYADGIYYMYQKESDQIVWNNTNETFRNGILNIDVTHISGDDELTGFALFWRINGSDYDTYIFQANDLGHYTVSKWIGDTWIPIKRDTYTAALKRDGQMNNIKIAFYGKNTEIFINDYFVDSYTDDSFISGSVGMGVWADPDSDVEIAFDNLIVYKYEENSPYLPSKENTIDTPEEGSTGSGEDCVRWDRVSISDVGKTMCVYGTVRTSWYSENQGAYIITFSEDPEVVYFILYGNWYYEDNELIGNCVMFTSKISKVYNTPVLYIQETDTIYKCIDDISGDVQLHHWDEGNRGVRTYAV
jgi:hypothetical protein